MARSTFQLLFYVNSSKEKNGIVPIMGRVAINGTMTQFSCKREREFGIRKSVSLGESKEDDTCVKSHVLRGLVLSAKSHFALRLSPQQSHLK